MGMLRKGQVIDGFHLDGSNVAGILRDGKVVFSGTPASGMGIVAFNAMRINDGFNQYMTIIGSFTSPVRYRVTTPDIFSQGQRLTVLSIATATSFDRDTNFNQTFSRLYLEVLDSNNNVIEEREWTDV